MTDLAVAFGLVLVLEGLVWALAPQTAARVLDTMSRLPVSQVKLAGTAAVAAGVGIVWLVRG